MNTLRQVLKRTFLLALFLPLMAHADMVVIVHPHCEASTLTRREIINIFMGRFRYLPSGQPARPYDLPARDPGKRRFYLTLTGKDLSDIDAYWARLVFTGSAAPPHETENAEEMLQKVAHNPQGIGYMERSQVDKRVRIIFDPEH
jgi:ABC-type phosphate transport system substrate-binding protein